MNYLNKLTEEQLVELVKIYCKKNFIEVKSIERRYNRFDISVIVRCYDENNKETILEDEYSLFDYMVVFWDRMGECKKQICLLEYRRTIYEWVGNRYALDYLLDT